MLTVSSLAKHFGTLRAVNSLSFVAKPGEVLGLVGLTGARKATTFRCQDGILSPDAGTTEVQNLRTLDRSILVSTHLLVTAERSVLESLHPARQEALRGDDRRALRAQTVMLAHSPEGIFLTLTTPTVA